MWRPEPPPPESTDPCDPNVSDDLSFCDLRGITIESTLVRKNLRYANLSGATIGVHATGADLADVDATGIRLWDAVLYGTRLDGWFNRAGWRTAGCDRYHRLDHCGDEAPPPDSTEPCVGSRRPQ